MVRIHLRQYAGFFADTLPAQRRVSFIRNFTPPRSMEEIAARIQQSYRSRERYGPFGFGKWIHHLPQIDAFLQGNIYEVKPITAEFVPTLECTFACPDCTYRDWKTRTAAEKGKRYMDFVLMKHLLEELSRAGVKGIIWTGGGEPTLHPQFLDGMRFAKTLGMQNGLFTNGSMLTRKMVETLLFEIAPAFIRISINAPTPESHRRFHCYPSRRHYFSQILGILKHIAILKLDPRVRTTVGLGIIVNERNLAVIGDFGSFLHSLIDPSGGRIDYIAFRPTVHYGGADKTQLSAELAADAGTKYRGLVLPAAAGIRGLSSIFIEERFEDILRPQQTQVPFCLAHPWRVSIAYDGKVYLCAEQNGNPDFCIGDLAVSSFANIWRGPQRKKVIQRLNQELFHRSCPPICVLTYMNKVLNAFPFPLISAETAGIKQTLETLRGKQHPHVDFL
ncbi:MAG: radical SAM protein [Candidatus Margulisbacteria bacterium]|nr:radical SAM protein [Candidatus Margulisiibacteriota bacterium]